MSRPMRMPSSSKATRAPSVIISLEMTSPSAHSFTILPYKCLSCHTTKLGEIEIDGPLAFSRERHTGKPSSVKHPFPFTLYADRQYSICALRLQHGLYRFRDRVQQVISR